MSSTSYSSFALDFSNCSSFFHLVRLVEGGTSDELDAFECNLSGSGGLSSSLSLATDEDGLELVISCDCSLPESMVADRILGDVNGSSAGVCDSTPRFTPVKGSVRLLVGSSGIYSSSDFTDKAILLAREGGTS
jgi:hypothetical protein